MPKNGRLTVSEIKKPEYVYKLIQMKHFGDEYETLDRGKNISFGSSLLKLDPVFDPERKVIRIGGRLRMKQNAKLSSRTMMNWWRNWCCTCIAKPLMLDQKLR